MRRSGADPAQQAIRRELADRIFVWLSRLQTRETTPREAAETWVDKSTKGGIVIGQW